MLPKENTDDKLESQEPCDFSLVIPKNLFNALKQCIECGKCVGSCTAARVTDFNIREIVSKVLNNKEELLSSEEIWKCFLCGHCEMICPKKDMDLPKLILLLREEAIQRGYAPAKLKNLTNWLDKFYMYGKIAGPNQVSERRRKQIRSIAEKSGVDLLKQYILKLTKEFE